MESNRDSLVKLIGTGNIVENILDQLPKGIMANTINVTVNALVDPGHVDIYHPVEGSVSLPTDFFMFFKEAKSFMFHVRNGLSMIDLFTYFELSVRHARDKQFTTSTMLWKELEKESEVMGREYKLNSIRKSFYKLVKSGLIIKVSAYSSVYAINKILAFQGQLSNRAELIKDDFRNATMTQIKESK